METLTRSLHTHGRYCIGLHELTAGDVVEFTDGEHICAGRVEHDGLRYIVVSNWRHLPLAEIVTARFVGRGTL